MIDRLEMLKVRLQNMYALAQASGDEKHFFLWLYDYVKSFDKESELGGFAAVADKEREVDFAKIDELRPIAIKEIEATYKKVAKYVKDKKITHEVIVKELDEYVMAKDGLYTSSREHIEDLYDKLSYALMTMVEEGTEDDLKFAQEFGIISDKRRITEWTFSPSYSEFEIHKNGLKKIQETRLWYSWSKVVLAYQSIDDYSRETIKELFDGKKHFEAMNWSGLQSEMMDVVGEKNNPNSRPYEFISKDYRYYLAKVHVRAIEFLEYDPTARESKNDNTFDVIRKPAKEVKWSLKLDDNYTHLTVNNKSYHFKRDLDYAGIILSRLDESEEGYVVCEDIYKEMMDSENPSVKNPKRVPYDAGKSLNKRLFEELGVSEFLNVKTYDIRFNDTYTRVR